MAIILYLIGVIGWAIAGLCCLRVYTWAQYLKRTRIVIFYKGKSKINVPMIEWMKWAQTLERDKSARGHTVYKMGGTDVGILKKLPRDQGKTKSQKVKDVVHGPGQ